MKIEKISNNTEELTTSSLKESTAEFENTEQSDFQKLLNPNAMNNFSLSFQNSDLDLISTDMTFDLDTLNISEQDAIFFSELVKNPQFSLNASTGEILNLGELASTTDIQAYKSMSVSKGLFNIITKAQETQKPVRLDFDNNVTVIMKVDKEGKLTAAFIPGDNAVEAYLKNNIPYLKQRFDEQNLAYNDIYYRPNNNNRRNHKGEYENE